MVAVLIKIGASIKRMTILPFLLLFTSHAFLLEGCCVERNFTRTDSLKFVGESEVIAALYKKKRERTRTVELNCILCSEAVYFSIALFDLTRN